MTDLERETKRYMGYATTARELYRRHGKVDQFILAALASVIKRRPSERLACAAAGTLVGVEHSYTVEMWWAS